MSDVSDSINSVLSKMGEFLNILDLSFFVAGAACLGAVGFWVYLFDIPLFSKFEGAFGVAVAVVGCYVLGLICFAVGRGLGKRFFSNHRRVMQLEDFIRFHGLADEEPYKHYIEQIKNKKRFKADGLNYLYTRLWAEIRHNKEIDQSFFLVRRYWIMAATYDGLAFALIIWMIVILIIYLRQRLGINIWMVLSINFILLVSSYYCSKEARILERHQVEELVASLASAKDIEKRRKVIMGNE